MTWFIGTFTDILGTCGLLLGCIIVAILAVFMAVCYLFLGWLVFSLAFATVYAALYYWPRYGYYKLRGKEVPPDPIAAWAGRKARKVKAWMDNVSAWLEKKHEEAKAEAEAQRWK